MPGERRFSPDGTPRRGRDRERPDSEQRAAIRTQVNQFTLPPESILIRRMHGIVAVVLQQLRAGADWGAIAAEYLHGAPPRDGARAGRGRLPRAPGADSPAKVLYRRVAIGERLTTGANGTEPASSRL